MTSPSPPSCRPQAEETTTTTLYETSPHAPIDKRLARRRLRLAHRAGQHTNPTYITLLILFAALLWFIVPVSFYRRLVPWPFSSSSSPTADPASPIAGIQEQAARMPWQKTITLSSRTKGCHLVTNEVVPQLQEGLKGVKVGLLTLFIQHTSAALSLNENFDRDVRTDMDMALDHVVPESLPWKHTDEGPDDSVSHTKASIIGPTITIPITDGKLNTGTWQGIYLCEFRRMAHKRKIVATILP